MSNLELLPINIGGEWRLGGGDESTTLYPATGEVVGRLRAPSLADVEEAIQKADHAFRTSGWAQKKPHERAAVLHRVAQLIRERAEPLAQLQRLDNGKPINETRALVASAAGTFQYFAAACETMEEAITPARGDFMTMSVYEPMGVVAAITPWNSPIASEAQKLAPALAAGNAVVVKPAEATPLSALAVAELAQRAGMPAGVLNIVTADAEQSIQAFDRSALVLPLLVAIKSGANGAWNGSLAAAADRSQQLTRVLRNALHDVLDKLQFGQVLLATVGSTAPFVGLLGTVWGIYHALTGMAAAGQITIDKVSGPVGEALIMTAAGLAVAIPAVLAYNVFGRRIGRIEADLEGFARDLRELFSTANPQ